MSRIEELGNWDWPGSERVRDGYGWKYVPKCTQDNFIMLIDKVNEMIATMNNKSDATKEGGE